MSTIIVTWLAWLISHMQVVVSTGPWGWSAALQMPHISAGLAWGHATATSITSTLTHWFEVQ